MVNIRNYGFGDSTPYMEGPPRVLRQAIEIEGVKPFCPNCGCESIFEIEVDLKDYPRLKPGKQSGVYLGCPACPWASPMIATSK